MSELSKSDLDHEAETVAGKLATTDLGKQIVAVLRDDESLKLLLRLAYKRGRRKADANEDF